MDKPSAKIRFMSIMAHLHSTCDHDIYSVDFSPHFHIVIDGVEYIYYVVDEELEWGVKGLPRSEYRSTEWHELPDDLPYELLLSEFHKIYHLRVRQIRKDLALFVDRMDKMFAGSLIQDFDGIHTDEQWRKRVANKIYNPYGE